MRWICLACGQIYDEALGCPQTGIAPGTAFADLPADWECPFCGTDKQQFVPEEEQE